MNSKGVAQLKRHEGFERMPYYCSAGYLTAGYGYNLDANGLCLAPADIAAIKTLGISESSAESLLLKFVANVEKDLYKKIPWIVRLNEARQTVLINMAYNLKGNVEGLLKFKRTLALIEHGDYDNAADAMLQSKWRKDVKGRALELAEQMRTGRFSV